MSSRSIFQSLQSNKQGLPVSRPPPLPPAAANDKNITHTNAGNKGEEQQGRIDVGIRRRLSSLPLKIQLQPTPMSSSSLSYLMGSFRRSKSMSSLGEYSENSIRKWWDWGWAWILSRKPIFAEDLEMNEQEIAALYCHNKGSWRHVLYKLKNELGKLVWGSSHNTGLPQTACSSSSYSYLAIDHLN